MAALFLVALVTGCASRQAAPVVVWADGLEDGAVLVHESAERVCVQVWRDEDGSIVYPWRCVPADRVRELVFPESR